MGTIKARSEIKKEDTWAVEDLFESDDALEESIQKLETLLLKVKDYKGHVMESASTLLEVLELDSEMGRIGDRLRLYSASCLHVDLDHVTYQKLQGKIATLSSKIAEEWAFLIPEIIQTEESILKSYYEEEPKLRSYQKGLTDIYLMKDHYLSEREETLLAPFYKVLTTGEEVATLLKDTDLRFGTIQNERGEEVELTESNYSNYIESFDRKVRESAFKTLYQGYASVKNTLSATLNSFIEANVILGRVRHYQTPLEAALYPDQINPEIYHNLIRTVRSHLKPLYEYYDFKKEQLEVSEFHLYDNYVPLVKEEAKVYTFEEAEEIVIKSLSVLGEDYIEVLNKALKERWIDKYNNRNKMTGAYSDSCYDCHPFVLLNFEGKVIDVSTLAHELGHAMHSYYSNQTQSYQDSSYSIFVAEVASTVNELLLFHYLLNHSEKKETKRSILNHLLELFKSTIYRQTMFAEFEEKIYNLVFQGEKLTSDDLNTIYYKLNQDYFGPNVIVDKEIRYEWERIDHFYMNFYVYQYATGLAAACHIVDGILNHKEGALENYLKFLTLGGSDYPVEELKVAGVDLTKPETIESALTMFQNYLEEMKNMI